MRKRLMKKLHKKYLLDVVCDVSLSSIWRIRLFDSEYNEKFIISSDNLNGLSEFNAKVIKKYRLRYYVYKIEGDIPEKDFYYEGGVYFRFEAIKFHDIYDYSFNNTNVR